MRVATLLDPKAVPMGVEYAALVESDVAIVVQHVRLDSRRAVDSMFASTGFPGRG